MARTIYDGYGLKNRSIFSKMRQRKEDNLSYKLDDQRDKHERAIYNKGYRKRQERKLRRQSAGKKVELDRYSTMSNEEFMKSLDKDMSKEMCDMLKYHKFDNELFESNQAVEEANIATYKRQMERIMQPLLYRGASKEAVMQTMGMFLGIALTSRKFRKCMADNIKTKARSKRYDKYQTEIYDLENRMDDLENQRNGGEIDDKAYFMEKDRLEKMQAHYIYETNGRMPYSPKTTAQIQMRILVNSQKLMAENPDQCERIIRQYNRSVSNLYEIAAKDGVQKEDVISSFNILASNMIEEDPSFSGCFYEVDRMGYEPEHTHLATGEKLTSGRYILKEDGKFINRLEDCALTPNLPEGYAYSYDGKGNESVIKMPTYKKKEEYEEESTRIPTVETSKEYSTHETTVSTNEELTDNFEEEVPDVTKQEKKEEKKRYRPRIVDGKVVYEMYDKEKGWVPVDYNPYKDNKEEPKHESKDEYKYEDEKEYTQDEDDYEPEP
ncbi:hypothetical protein [Filifactor alocis]|uniref:hypothetical protein n=1 Tax=Filifactor alocis TaxID=143361 RepID=UPI003FA04714